MRFFEAVAEFVYDWAVPILIIGLIIVIIALVAGFRIEGKRHDRLMAQCMADGHKEYECL